MKIDLLNKLETYVKDIIYSSETKNYAPYNYNYVKNIVEKYYLGETKYSDELDWFLTFEIYRKNLFNNL